jgi:hypothetical protein
MNAEAILYSFRFVFLERIPIQPVRGVCCFSRFAVGHCPGAEQSGPIHYEVPVAKRNPCRAAKGLERSGVGFTIHYSLFTIHKLKEELRNGED